MRYKVFVIAGLVTAFTAVSAKAAYLLGGGGGCSGLGCIALPVVVCAPEVKQGNISAVDRVVSELSRSPEFRGAREFQAETARIGGLSDIDQKISGYLSLVGVDANDNQAVAEFIGARDAADGPWINNLQQNLRLNRAQSERLAGAITTALLGDLR